MKGVLLSAPAQKDLRELWAKHSLSSEAFADAFDDAVYKTFALVRDFPFIGHVRPELKFKGLRQFWIQGYQRYVMLYRIRPRSIFVDRVVYGGRDLFELQV